MEIEIFKKTFGSKGGIIGTALVVLFIAYMVFEIMFLTGDLVVRDSVDIPDEEDLVAIEVTEPGEIHLVQVSTRRKERKLKFRLEGPDGEPVYEDSEWSTHKGMRSFDFNPTEAGTYKLFVNPGGGSYSQWGSASVQVYVNDRRKLTRVFGRLNF